MQPYRPKALDDLNSGFFNRDGGTPDGAKDEEQPIIENVDFTQYFDTQPQPAQEAIQIQQEQPIQSDVEDKKMPKLPEKDPETPYSKEEILDFLAEDFSALDKIADNALFTDATQVQPEFLPPTDRYEKVDYSAPTQPLVDEKAIYESFPDITDSIIDLSAKPQGVPDDQKLSEKEALKRAKDNAKASIENEKKKIKAQKKLEKTVQRPFGKRRVAVVLMLIFLLIGLLASAVASVMYAVEKSDNGMVKISNITVAYVDGDKISGDEHIGRYIFVKSESISSVDTLLFMNSASKPEVAEVRYFTDNDLYALEQPDTGLYYAEASKILGLVKFETPNVAVARNAVEGYTFVVFAVLAIYLILVILLSSLRIGKLNSAIRKFKESYDLI